MPRDQVNKFVADFRDGQLFEALMQMPGWKEVYIPRLKAEIEAADRKVHDPLIREETMKDRNGYYRGLMKALHLIDEILRNKNVGEKYIHDHDIII